MKAYLVQCGEAEWDSILERFDDASLYQTYAYGVARAGRGNLVHILVKEGDKILAAGQAWTRRIPVLGEDIAYMPWGPMIRLKNSEMSRKTMVDIYSSLENPVSDFKHKTILRFAPRLSSDQDRHDTQSILDESSCYHLDSVSPYRTLLLDIDRPLEKLRQNLRKDWKNKINRALKSDVNMEIGTGDDLFQKFIGIYKDMRMRKKYREGVDISMYRRLQGELGDKHKMKILVASISGEPVGSILWSEIGDTAVTLLRATKKTALNTGVAQLVSWRMVESLHSSGCRQLDLGGINPEMNPGTYQYKSGLGGKLASDISSPGTYYFFRGPIQKALVLLAEHGRNLSVRLTGKGN
jgi:lipid II:glycine glycyltransferase (peptidoglycan interpeptide bridge formation enzyme)